MAEDMEMVKQGDPVVARSLVHQDDPEGPAPAPAARKEYPDSVVISDVEGEPPMKLRLINIGTDDECWQTNEAGYRTAMKAAELKMDKFSESGDVVSYDGMPISWHAGT